jgi:phosphate uptake regulator
MQANGLDENLRFLVLETTQQLERVRAFLDEPSPKLYEEVFLKEEYINNLKSIIQRKCFVTLHRELEPDPATLTRVKAYEITAVNLERIGDYCKNLVDQARGIDDDSVLDDERYGPFFVALEGGLAQIERALFQRDTQAAMQVCEAERTIDNLYRKVFSGILDELKTSEEETRDLVSAMFVYRYLERMGDSLLNVGEAIVSLGVGATIRFSRLRAIQDILDIEEFESDGDTSSEGVALEPVAETRSGCRIDRLRMSANDQAGMMMIVKDGPLRKVLDEKKSNDRWQEISPGLAPQVVSYSRAGDHGTLVFEYLPGKTFQQILLQGSGEQVEEGLERLIDTLHALWLKTRSPEVVKARFVKQARKRLDSVLAVHPHFAQPPRKIGGHAVEGLEDLLKQAAKVEGRNEPPFSVYIHGDLNVDNIILQEDQEQVHFIDLHRSRMMDYVQDVSVFIVSNLRLQVFDVPLRRRLRAVATRFCAFGREFAEETGDTSFEARLGLGLARSFLTSTRFILDPDLARWHYLRARYLLERVARDDAAFRVPSELFVD